MFKIKISYNKIFSYFYIASAFFGVIVIVFVSLFLYKNFYKTITSSQEILILRREIVTEDIDINRFDEIIKKIEEKTKARESDVFLRF